MNSTLRTYLISLARQHYTIADVSHDVNHALRVLANAEHIAQYEGGDPDVIIPAALFHDVVMYPKNDVRSEQAAHESAVLAKGLLDDITAFPQGKIIYVQRAIVEHSHSNGIRPESIESKIIQDADRLEATGAITIMRVFASSGQMERPFYNTTDPFCDSREPEGNAYAIDFFYSRLCSTSASVSPALIVSWSYSPSVASARS